MPELLAHTVTGADPLLSSWESGTWLHAWQRVPTCPAPKITLGAEPQLSFRGGRHFARAVTARCWGECSMSWGGSTGRGRWELVPGCPRLYPNLFPVLILFCVLSRRYTVAVSTAPRRVHERCQWNTVWGWSWGPRTVGKSWEQHLD